MSLLHSSLVPWYLLRYHDNIEVLYQLVIFEKEIIHSRCLNFVTYDRKVWKAYWSEWNRLRIPRNALEIYYPSSEYIKHLWEECICCQHYRWSVGSTIQHSSETALLTPIDWSCSNRPTERKRSIYCRCSSITNWDQDMSWLVYVNLRARGRYYFKELFWLKLDGGKVLHTMLKAGNDVRLEQACPPIVVKLIKVGVLLTLLRFLIVKTKL